MLIALAALVFASSGVAVAATVITSSQIKNGTIRLVDISPTARKALRSAVGPAGVRGPAGVAGPVGAQGAPGVTGPQGARGETGRSALEPLRSGESIRGAWAMNDVSASYNITAVTFPVPAPNPVDSAHVVVAGNDPAPGSGCSGSAAAPVAGPGFVCIYFATASGTIAAFGLGALTNITDSQATGDGSDFGFVIYVLGGAAWYGTGTWAYTAP